MEQEYQWLLEIGDVNSLLTLANKSEASGNLHVAASALDRAFGLDSPNEMVRQLRQKLLERLAITEHGIAFRYIPGGPFLMGSDQGDPDEKPVHLVELGHFWISETPISWADYCRILDWEPPPRGMPKPTSSPPKPDKAMWHLVNSNKMCLQYCEDETQRAQDWHAHAQGQQWQKGSGGPTVSSQEIFGKPRRGDPSKAWSYNGKPMICVGSEQAHAFCMKMSSPHSESKSLLASLFSRKNAETETPATPRYRLPTEAEWEKAARGGLVSCKYPWGTNPPTNELCDFNRFEKFSILPMKQFPPNSYGLYAMSGGVWEWTTDWYDAEFYVRSPRRDPHGPQDGRQRVVRGGSWADCSDAVTVSFRMSMSDDAIPNQTNPNIGFRICRDDRSHA
jgi:formylglycine-generating enzyme required for sulfatase activity